MTTHTLRLARMLPHAREQVFDAFASGEAVKAWFGPGGFTVPRASVDFRVGGSYRLEMRSPEDTVHVLAGTYRDIRRPERIVFTFVWQQGDLKDQEMLVTLTFAEKPGATELTLTQEPVPTESSVEAHRGGWTGSLDKLAALLDSRSKSAAR